MEKNLLKQSGIIALISTFIVMAAWFGFSKLSLGAYNEKNLTKQFLAEDSEVFKTLVIEVGTDTVARIIAGTSSMTRTGTASYQYQPRIQYDGVTGLWTFKNSGGTETVAFGTVSASYVAAEIGSATAKYVLQDNGSSTGQSATNPTFAGQGTITASFGANGLVISPAEYSSVNNATGELQSQITTAAGSITNHAHTGNDGTTQISHNNVTGTGANSHAILDNFVASKAAASGVASLDASSLVVQNPASGTSTPGASKTVMSDGTGKILDGWLSDTVTKLGTPTTDNISEGSTNKYYTDARVNATIGSSSITSPQVSPKITFTSPAAGQFLKIIDAAGNVENGTSSITVDFSAVTGSATASQLPLISGLLGSATSSQLPTVLKLYGTTTEQAAGDYGQLYVQSSSGVPDGIVTGFGTLTTTSLVSYYRLENLTDSFGTNTLTNYGATTFVAGKYRTCATFNGTDQYLQTSVLSTQTTNVSMFGWVYIASASERRPFFGNGVGVTGYALGVGGTSGVDVGNTLIGVTPGVLWIDFGNGIGTGWHHVGMTRDATTWRGYIDGVVAGNTSTANPIVPATGSSIGFNTQWTDNYFNNKIDDVVFYNKCLSAAEIVELYNNTGAGILDIYTRYSAKYKDPANGNTILEILTTGTVTTEASYIYNNATTTVWGLGTNTTVTGTISGAYAGWTNRPIRVSAVDIGSSKEIKDNIKTIKIKPDLLDAEGLAKQNYIAGAKSAWMAANQASYTTVMSETGTGSVTVVDTDRMETDYNNYIEFEWASDMNQDTYTEDVQKTYEKGFWQMYNLVTPKSWNPRNNPNAEYEGFVVEEMPPVVWGEDGQSLNIMSIVAYMVLVQQTLKADTIFALSTLKELITTGTVTQSSVEYCNDRLEVLNPPPQSPLGDDYSNKS